MLNPLTRYTFIALMILSLIGFLSTYVYYSQYRDALLRIELVNKDLTQAKKISEEKDRAIKELNLAAENNEKLVKDYIGKIDIIQNATLRLNEQLVTLERQNALIADYLNGVIPPDLNRMLNSPGHDASTFIDPPKAPTGTVRTVPEAKPRP